MPKSANFALVIITDDGRVFCPETPDQARCLHGNVWLFGKPQTVQEHELLGTAIVACNTHKSKVTRVPARIKAPDMLGYCPTCKEPVVSRERRPNGNDRCKAGHTYPSKDSLNLKLKMPASTTDQLVAEARKRHALCNETTEITVDKLAGDLGPLIHAMMHKPSGTRMLLIELAGRALALADRMDAKGYRDYEPTLRGVPQNTRGEP